MSTCGDQICDKQNLRRIKNCLKKGREKDSKAGKSVMENYLQKDQQEVGEALRVCISNLQLV